jgi:hypothetical protein
MSRPTVGSNSQRLSISSITMRLPSDWRHPGASCPGCQHQVLGFGCGVSRRPKTLTTGLCTRATLWREDVFGCFAFRASGLSWLLEALENLACGPERPATRLFVGAGRCLRLAPALPDGSRFPAGAFEAFTCGGGRLVI